MALVRAFHLIISAHFVPKRPCHDTIAILSFFDRCKSDKRTQSAAKRCVVWQRIAYFYLNLLVCQRQYCIFVTRVVPSAILRATRLMPGCGVLLATPVTL